MNNKKRNRMRNQKLRQKLNEQDADTRGFHSFLYHSYFEDYTEYRRMQPNGSTKLVREYTGTWYQQKLEGKQYIAIRILYLFLFLLMAGFFIGTAFVPGKSGTAWYMAVTELATILFLSAFAYVLVVNYIFAPRKMTIGDFRSAHKMLEITSIGLTVCFLMDAICTMVYLLVHGIAEAKIEIYSFVFLLIASMSAFSIFMIEKRVTYEEEKNEIKTIEDGVTITFSE